MSDLIYIGKGTGALNDNVVRTFWQRQSHVQLLACVAR